MVHKIIAIPCNTLPHEKTYPFQVLARSLVQEAGQANQSEYESYFLHLPRSLDTHLYFLSAMPLASYNFLAD